MNEDYQIVPATSYQVDSKSTIDRVLSAIRPAWQGRSLIERVKKLLPVDPSSACQRLLNAAIHDLKEKVIVAGIDIAKEVAQDNKLPPLNTEEDIDNYSTTYLLDLCNGMGLISRPEWRRLKRVYEIRKDLEHEDDEYEARPEECLLIFTTCIEFVLSRDPINLLRITDVKQIIEEPRPIIKSHELIENYKHAPAKRKEEILKFLISTALDAKSPDITRQNSFELLKCFEQHTDNQVKILIASHIQDKIYKKKMFDILYAKIAFAIGVLPYLKKPLLRDLFSDLHKQLQQVGYTWTKHNEHGKVLEILEDIGGLNYCPNEIRISILKWLILAYIGEEGGYGTFGHNRKVFYSDTAAPIIKRILENCPSFVLDELKELSGDKDIKKAMSSKFIERRFEDILDIVETINIPS